MGVSHGTASQDTGTCPSLPLWLWRISFWGAPILFYPVARRWASLGTRATCWTQEGSWGNVRRVEAQPQRQQTLEREAGVLPVVAAIGVHGLGEGETILKRCQPALHLYLFANNRNVLPAVRRLESRVQGSAGGFLGGPSPWLADVLLTVSSAVLSWGSDPGVSFVCSHLLFL